MRKIPKLRCVALRKPARRAYTVRDMLKTRVLFFLLLLAAWRCGDDTLAVAPLADAGFDRVVSPGARIALDGSKSQTTVGISLTYHWRLVYRPPFSAAQLFNPASAKPELRVDELGYYLVELIVESNKMFSQPDLVTIWAANDVPVALAECGLGTNCQVVHGRTAVLDGRDSYDPDNNSLTYRWYQVTSVVDCATSCPTLAGCDPYNNLLSIQNEQTALASVVAPQVLDAQLVFRLVVEDPYAPSDNCLHYTVTNQLPTANAFTLAADVNEGETINLGVTAADADADLLTFNWVQTGGTPAAQILSPTNSSTAVLAPNVGADTVLQFAVHVDDGLASVQSNVVAVTVHNL